MALLTLRPRSWTSAGFWRPGVPRPGITARRYMVSRPACRPIDSKCALWQHRRGDAPRPACKSFRECGRGFRPSQQMTQKSRQQGNLRRPRFARRNYPFFYEYHCFRSALPFSGKLGAVSFDRESPPRDIHPSFHEPGSSAGGPLRYLGYRKLVDLKTQRNNLDTDQPTDFADLMALKNVGSCIEKLVELIGREQSR